MQISTVIISSSGNVLFTDSDDNHLRDCEEVWTWRRAPSFEEYRVHAVLTRIVEDKPSIYLKAQSGTCQLSISEFCNILGFGHWYWEYLNNATV